MYSASMDVPHYWTADQVQRLLDSLAAHNRHRARSAALIAMAALVLMTVLMSLSITVWLGWPAFKAGSVQVGVGVDDGVASIQVGHG